MKIEVYKKIKTEIELDVKLIAERLIDVNIDSILDGLMEEFDNCPEDYMPDGIELTDDIREALTKPLRKELEKLLTEC